MSKKYRIVIELETDIDEELMHEIAADAFVQLETIEDEDYGTYKNAKFEVEEVSGE